MLLAVVASLAVLGVVVVTNALAVHTEDFQLDGDIETDSGSQTVDWASLFVGSSTQPGATELALPDNFTASGFHEDFNIKTQRGATVFDSFDNTTYATGSKDSLPIQKTGNVNGWQCAKSNNVGGKVDIMNAYAASYTDPDTGHQILYFGQERNANDGDANVGFWFLQDGTVACTGGAGATNFTGHHRDGDLFIVSAFTSGGSVSNVTAYKWSSSDPTNGDNGSLISTGVSGGDCRLANGNPAPGGDSACATVNREPLSDIPWLTANKDDGVGDTLETSEFFEGGLDLTANNLGGKCFNTFISNTRSSQSLTATIFDYDIGQLGLCAIDTAQKWFPQDTATVSGGTGTVTFKLYENGTCSGTAAQTFTDTTAPYDTNNQTTYSVVQPNPNATVTISWSARFQPTDNGQPVGNPVDVTRCERSDLMINNSASAFPPAP